MTYLKVMSKISSLFRSTEILYMLVGGFAVAYWGYPRQSLDIDIVVDLKKECVQNFIDRAKRAGFLLDPEEVKFLAGKSNRFVMEMGDFRIDCWIPRSRFEKEALKNRKKKRVFGTLLNIITPEDLIISKLLAGRQRDIEDAKTVVLRRGRKLKLNYLRSQAASVDLSSSLRDLIS